MSDRELHALISGGCTEPEKPYPKITRRQVDAAARAMYEQRPKHTDPAHWVTPWDALSDAWKEGQRLAAICVLKAAMEAGQ